MLLLTFGTAHAHTCVCVCVCAQRGEEVASTFIKPTCTTHKFLPSYICYSYYCEEEAVLATQPICMLLRTEKSLDPAVMHIQIRTVA